MSRGGDTFRDGGRFQALLRSHVERCLQDIWEEPDLVTDVDGDYPFRSGAAMCWVAPRGGREPAVSVFAVATLGLRSSAGLLREVNALNASARWVSISFDDGAVHVRTELHWTAVDAAALGRALNAVTDSANDVGPLLAAVFGGRTPFPAEQVGEGTGAQEAA